VQADGWRRVRPGLSPLSAALTIACAAALVAVDHYMFDSIAVIAAGRYLQATIDWLAFWR